MGLEERDFRVLETSYLMCIFTVWSALRGRAVSCAARVAGGVTLSIGTCCLEME